MRSLQRNLSLLPLYGIFFVTTLSSIWVWHAGAWASNLFVYDRGRVVVHHEWYRLLTCAFLHGDVAHLVSNMFGLLVYGTPLLVKKKTNAFSFLVLYLGGVVFSSYVEHLVFSIDYRSLGASGGVFTILTASILLCASKKTQSILGIEIPQYIFSWIFFVFFFLAREVTMLDISDNVSHVAHIGGMVFGVAFSAVSYFSRDLMKRKSEDEGPVMR